MQKHSHFQFNAARFKAFEEAYQREAAVHPILCQLPTLLIAGLHLQLPPMRAVLRPAALRAFVSLFQTTRHPVWIELLLSAYGPFLGGLIAEDPDDPEEREAEVIARFCEAVAVADVTAQSITFELQGLTRARLDAAALAEKNWREVVLCPDMSRFASSEPSPEEALIAREASARESVSDVELLHTFGDRAALAELIEERFAGADAAARRRAYASLASRRSRLARGMRRQLRRRGA
jgi:hypothetical protein